jgi:RNA polymerase sigma-70 factor (ECF subfamily)
MTPPPTHSFNRKKINAQREEALRDQIVGLLPRLRRFAMSLAKDFDRADDLLQSACERALNRLDQFRQDSRLDSWLYRIVYTQWIDKVRRRQTRTDKLIVLGRDTESQSASTVSDSSLSEALDLRHALERLPPEHLAAVMLVCVEGYSYAEAAGVLNVPAGTVASRVSRARIMLSRFLGCDKSQALQLRKMEVNNDSAV